MSVIEREGKGNGEMNKIFGVDYFSIICCVFIWLIFVIVECGLIFCWVMDHEYSLYIFFFFGFLVLGFSVFLFFV